MNSITCRILGCGTSTGVPIPGCFCTVCTSSDPRNTRTRTSAYLRLPAGEGILIDTSPDLRMQALAGGITKVNAILYTHAHADHMLGFDDLRAFNYVQKASIPAYGTPDTLAAIKSLFSYAFTHDPNYVGGGVPRVTLHDFQPFDTLELFGLKIEVLQLLHGRVPVVGFRIGDFAYLTDCNAIPDESQRRLHGLKTLILDGLRTEAHPTHFTIEQAVEAASKLGAEMTYLIHMSHSVDYASTNALLPKTVQLAFDGLEVEVHIP